MTGQIQTFDQFGVIEFLALQFLAYKERERPTAIRHEAGGG